MNSPPTHSGVLEIQTLGGLSLRRRGGSELLSILSQPKRAALLCYLAMARGFVRRDRLLPLFWPESDDSHARACLRQAIHFLRRTLGENALVSRGDEEVAVNRELVWCDAVAFERAVAEGREEEAVVLYGGEFLPGFYLDGAPGIDQWLEGERDRLRRRAVANAWALAERRERAGDLARAAELGRTALALAPADDAQLRRFMLLLERSGDVSGALLEYQRYERLLRVEYDLDPAPEAAQLAGDIAARRRAGNGEASRSDAPVAPAPEPGRTPARGRRSRSLWLGVAVPLVCIGVIVIPAMNRAGRDAPRVLVLPLENSTGDSTLEPLGRLIADVVIRGVVLSGFAEAVPPPDANRSSPVDLARAVGAALVVSGRYRVAGDAIEVDAHVVALGGPGREIGVAHIRGSKSQLDRLAAGAADRILGAVATELDHPFGGPPLAAEGVRPPTYEAYRAYLEAAALFIDVEYERAIPAYERVLQLDSTFYRAAVELAWSQLNSGRAAAAESTFLSVVPHEMELDPESRAHVESGLASIHGTWARAFRIMREIHGCEAICNHELATMALAQRRVHAALRLLDDSPPTDYLVGLERWSGLHMLQTNVLFALGRHEDELREARHARERFPDLPRVLFVEGRALAALGRTTEAGAIVETLLRTRGSPALAVDIIDVIATRDDAAARNLYRRALALLAESGNDSYAATLASARCLIALGRHEDARKRLEPAHAGRLTDPMPLLYLGTAAAAMGDRTAAASAERALDSLRGTPVERAHNVMRRAMIAAMLGERARALHLMRTAYAAGFPYGPTLLYAPPFASLRDYPPFRQLVRPID